MTRLLAIADLHLARDVTKRALEEVPDHPNDWLIVAGDVAERFADIEWAFGLLAERFAKVIWVPGNHELWFHPKLDEPRGVARYETLVELARSHGITTPEDPFLLWPHAGETLVIAPLFLLYDYSFRPANVEREEVVAWAREWRNVSGDETRLSPKPFSSVDDWCAARLASSEARLSEEVPSDARTILINHWPLRQGLIRIPRAPRFLPWCGTVETHDWHKRFRARTVVSGHLHTRRTDIVGGTVFEEVSLGYPRQWQQSRGIQSYFREIIAPENV